MQIRHFTSQFETKVIVQSLDLIQSRVDAVLRLNQSVTSHSGDVIAQLARMRQMLEDQYAHAHANIRSVSQLASRMGRAPEPETPVRLTLSEQTGSDVTRSAMASLMETMDALRQRAGDIRAAWRATKTTVGDIWRTMINDDDALRNFYLNVYNDVNDVTSRAGVSLNESMSVFVAALLLPQTTRSHSINNAYTHTE